MMMGVFRRAQLANADSSCSRGTRLLGTHGPIPPKGPFMKRFATPLLATILLLLTGTPALGQVSLAVTGGVNIASMDISTDDDFLPDFQSVTRLSIGLAAKYSSIRRLGPSAGRQLLAKGGTF